MLNYGRLLEEVCAGVPDGVCCFFPSYQYMEDMLVAWDREGMSAYAIFTLASLYSIRVLKKYNEAQVNLFGNKGCCRDNISLRKF
jgi:Rad3-related DNA helicase